MSNEQPEDPCQMPTCDNLVQYGVRLEDGYELWLCDDCKPAENQSSGLVGKVLAWGLLLWSIVSILLLLSGVLAF